MSPALDAFPLLVLFADAAPPTHSAEVLASLARNLIVILGAGAVAGIICRWLNISILIGYLTIGTLLGTGGLPLVVDDGHYVSHLAEAGVFLLLFTIGLELSLAELAQLSRWMLVGGVTQLVLVSVPVAAVLVWFGTSVSGALLMAAAVAFSSTVLVFKALAETGDVTAPHGRRALAILLSQDVALVPLLLIIPLITPGGKAAGAAEYLQLAVNTVGLIVGIGLLRFVVGRFLVPFLSRLRSTEVVMLFTLALLGGVTYATALLGLPAPLGAFAAGLVLSDNRLSAQIDALVLPFREAFSAVFFVSLGLLLDPKMFFTEAYLFLPMCVAAIALKTGAGAVAMRLTGLPWRASVGMALGLSQVGEFGFVLALQAEQANLISHRGYTSFLLLAMVSMIFTPLLLSVGLKFVKAQPVDDEEAAEGEGEPHEIEKTAIVIGIGPVGKQIACRLEMAGVEPFLIDLSPVNLYQFAQQGFRVLSGEASDPNLLRRALAPTAQLVAVCVPDDDAALRIVRSVREMNKTCRLVVRCRYVANMKPLKKAGADVVVSEESEASTALLHSLDGSTPCANGQPVVSPLQAH
ncbi:MAG TPA: cation:proton antiporter [Pirellulales bacterium]